MSVWENAGRLHRRSSWCPPCNEEEESRLWVTVGVHRFPASTSHRLHRLTQASVSPP